MIRSWRVVGGESTKDETGLFPQIVMSNKFFNAELGSRLAPVATWYIHRRRSRNSLFT